MGRSAGRRTAISMLALGVLLLMAAASSSEAQTTSASSQTPGEAGALKDVLGPTGAEAIEGLLAHSKGFVGLQMLNLTEGLRTYFEVPEGLGVLVAEVEPQGPAAESGLRAGDVIVEVEGSRIQSSMQVADLIGRATTDTVDVRFFRGGRERSATVPVEQRRTVVLKLSPSIIHQRIERAPGSSSETVISVQAISEQIVGATNLDLAVDQLRVFFSGEGLRRKMDRLEQLDLQAMEMRIRNLEAELAALEKQLPKISEVP